MGGRGGILVKCHDENFRELRHFKRPTSHTPTPPPQVSPPPLPQQLSQPRQAEILQCRVS